MKCIYESHDDGSVADEALAEETLKDLLPGAPRVHSKGSQHSPTGMSKLNS